MATLTTKQRNKLPPSKFVFRKERKYPIPDIAHARSALSYGKRYLSAGKYRYLKGVVFKKFPSLK